MENQEVEMASGALGGKEVLSRIVEVPCSPMAKEEVGEEEGASLLDGASPKVQRDEEESGPARVGGGGADVQLTHLWNGLKQGNLMRVIQPFLGPASGGKGLGGARGRHGAPPEGVSEDDVEQGGSAAGSEHAEFLVLLQRRVEKFLLALGCCCLLLVALLALLGLGVIVSWLSSGSSAAVAASPAASGPGGNNPGAATAGPAAPSTGPPGADAGAAASSGGGGGWVGWMDWFKLGNRKCSNVQVPSECPRMGLLHPERAVAALPAERWNRWPCPQLAFTLCTPCLC